MRKGAIAASRPQWHKPDNQINKVMKPETKIICPNGQEVFPFALLALKGALKLEILGMKRHGESAFATAKRLLCIRSNKTKVLAELESFLLRQGISVIRNDKFVESC